MLDTLETTNGHAKGRAVPPLPAFTFPDSGITIHVPRLSPNTQALIAEQVQREMPPRPEPPIQAVEGLDGKLHDEPNPANPEYLAALREWVQSANIEIGGRFRQLIMRRLVVEVDGAAVAQLREDMAAIGSPLPDDADDRQLYLDHICISSAIDFEALMAFVQRRAGPTEAATAEHRAAFRGDVSGS